MDWRPYLDRALFWASVQRRFLTVGFLLNEDYLHNLGLNINRVGQRITEMLANPELDQTIRIELQAIRNVLARHQTANYMGQTIGGSQQGLYGAQAGTIFQTLPPELIQQILGHTRLPGSGSSS